MNIGYTPFNFYFCFCLILNIMIMQQRVLTFSRRFNVIDSYGMNLDDVTKQLNENGWTVKQIVSTTFNHQIGKDGQPYPVFVISLLVEKA